MYRLLHPNQVPPRGWRWRCLDSRCPVELKGRTEDEMVELAALHCKGNNLPVGMGFHALVIHQMCEQYASEGLTLCKDKAVIKAKKSRFPSIQQIYVGTTTLLDWAVLGGRTMVEPIEANRRADICMSCPQHVRTNSCDGCKSGPLHALVEKIVGPRQTRHGKSLKVCGVCGCMLRAKVWLPLDVIHRHAPAEWNDLLPNHCWAKKP